MKPADASEARAGAPSPGSVCGGGGGGSHRRLVRNSSVDDVWYYSTGRYGPVVAADGRASALLKFITEGRGTRNGCRDG